MKHLPFSPLLVAAYLTGCVDSPAPPAFALTLRLSPTPALIGPTRVLLDITDIEGRPVPGAEVSIEGTAEERADREARPRIADDEGGGRYVVTDFDLDVGGRWTLAVRVTDGRGDTVTRVFPITVFGGS